MYFYIFLSLDEHITVSSMFCRKVHANYCQ